VSFSAAEAIFNELLARLASACWRRSIGWSGRWVEGADEDAGQDEHEPPDANRAPGMVALARQWFWSRASKHETPPSVNLDPAVSRAECPAPPPGLRKTEDSFFILELFLVKGSGKNCGYLGFVGGHIFRTAGGRPRSYPRPWLASST